MELTLYYRKTGKHLGYDYSFVFYAEQEKPWRVVIWDGVMEHLYSYNGFLTEC